MLMENFHLQKHEAQLTSEKLLQMSPLELKSLNSLVEEEYRNCPHCKSITFCRHSIGGSGNDPVDDFRLICPKCGEIDQFVHVDMGNDQETCPWCGLKA
jgi:Zn finger protein HypA/HybF involved in hydrogenase expression